MLYKFAINGIFCEISFPEKGNNKTIIILPGLPEYPRPKDMMEELSEKGYYVIYPRYRGTFESKGDFLNHDPTEDILEVIESIKSNETQIEFYNQSTFKIPSSDITIIGASFGGSVALQLSKVLTNSRFIIGAPVLDFKSHGGEEQDLVNLKRFLQEGFPNLYRFKTSDFDRLLSGEVISSVIKIKNFKNKIYLAHGNLDETVSFKKVKEFCEAHKEIEFIEVKNAGHLSVSRMYQKGVIDRLL